MASFPGSVFAPTVKSAGQTIQAGHVNDVQDEVVAIEDGYRNATAPLNSSGSTVATLSVAGGSTFAGTMQVTGGSTFTVRPVEPPPAAVRVAIAGVQAVTDGGISTIAWAAGDYAINSSMFSGANSSRITPQSTGVFAAIAEVEFNINSSGYRTVRIVDSSGGFVGQTQGPTATNAVVTMQVSGTKRFDVTGGWLKVQVSQGAASTMSIANNNGRFSVFKL